MTNQKEEGENLHNLGLDSAERQPFVCMLANLDRNIRMLTVGKETHRRGRRKTCLTSATKRPTVVWVVWGQRDQHTRILILDPKIPKTPEKPHTSARHPHSSRPSLRLQKMRWTGSSLGLMRPSAETGPLFGD